MLLARNVLGDVSELKVLSTTSWRLNRFGPLAAIWRTLSESAERQRWPELTDSG